MISQRNENNIIIHKNKFKIIYLFASYMIIGIPIWAMIMSIYSKYNIITYLVIIQYIILGLISIIDIYIIIKNRDIMKEVILILIVIMVFYFYSIYNWPQNKDVIDFVIFRRYVQCLLAYILFRNIKEYNIIHKYNIILSKVSISIVYILWILTKDFYGLDYLTISYSLLIPGLYLFSEFILHSKKSSIIFSILSLIILILYGGRSPLLIFIIGLFLLRSKPTDDLNFKNKKFLQNLFLLFLAIVIILSMEYILEFIEKIFYLFFSYSRNLELIVSGQITNLSGRNTYYSYLITKIMERPWTGYGIAGDMVLMYNSGTFYIRPGSNLYGMYAHNGIIETITEYGFLFGILFWVLILVWSWKIFRKKLNLFIYELWVILFVAGVIRTILGLPYWYSIPLWAYLGLISNIFKYDRRLII